MGSLTLSPSGPVYADAQVFIYSVGQHPIYAPLLRPLWESVARGDHDVVSSESSLLEVLVGLMRKGESALETDYENFFVYPGIRLLPATPSIRRAGARLRAMLSSLRTPDAIHAATASSWERLGRHVDNLTKISVVVACNIDLSPMTKDQTKRAPVFAHHGGLDIVLAIVAVWLDRQIEWGVREDSAACDMGRKMPSPKTFDILVEANKTRIRERAVAAPDDSIPNGHRLTSRRGRPNKKLTSYLWHVNHDHGA